MRATSRPSDLLDQCLKLRDEFATDLESRKNEVKKTTPIPAYSNESAGLMPMPPATGDAYSLSSRSFHEVWAQWLAWLYGHKKDSGVLYTFEILDRLQSRHYKTWQKIGQQRSRPYSRLIQGTALHLECSVVQPRADFKKFGMVTLTQDSGDI